MVKKILYLDLDGTYRVSIPGQDVCVLTNLYNNDYSYNVNSNIEAWDQIYNEYSLFIENLDVTELKVVYDNIDVLSVSFFITFFYPLGQWFSKIDHLVDSGILNSNTEVHFSSYCENKKVFIVEAEGEANGQFLYKKSFFLSYYIKNYLQTKGFQKFNALKIRTFEAKVNFYLRGFIIMSVKITQLIFYKLFVFNRNKLKHVDANSNKVIVSSRGIVQTQFISNLYKKYGEDMLLFINESSSKPFRNLRAAKTLKSFYYAEGEITFKQLFREVNKVIKAYNNKKNNISSHFYGVQINVLDLVPESSIKHFHSRTYAYTIENSLLKLKEKFHYNFNKLISMEMLPPFSYYLKDFTQLDVVQLQTTAMNCARYPNFVYGDKFYFSDKETYNNFQKLGFSFANKFDFVENIKYIGLTKNEKLKSINSITYFSQPIYVDEENSLIQFLKEVCNYRKIKFKIKFHPRAAIPEIDLSDIEIIDFKEDALEVIANSDIVATRTSSIGVDCWFLNKPVLFFVNGTLKKDVFSYIPDDYKGTISNNLTPKQMSSLLDEITEDFYAHNMHQNYTMNEASMVQKILGIK